MHKVSPARELRPEDIAAAMDRVLRPHQTGPDRNEASRTTLPILHFLRTDRSPASGSAGRTPSALTGPSQDGRKKQASRSTIGAAAEISSASRPFMKRALSSQRGHAVAGRDNERLDRQFDRLEEELPDSASGFLRLLRRPSSRWIRIPVGILLIAGGLFSFLPILGLWMVPLGALLLAQDVPFLRRPVGRVLVWLERHWIKWKRRRGG
jgi:hypothetical protein